MPSQGARPQGTTFAIQIIQASIHFKAFMTSPSIEGVFTLIKGNLLAINVESPPIVCSTLWSFFSITDLTSQGFYHEEVRHHVESINWYYQLHKVIPWRDGYLGCLVVPSY